MPTHGVCVCMHVVSSYAACTWHVNTNFLVGCSLTTVWVGEKVVLGSNGGAITAGSQLCRVESITSKWL